MPLFEHGDFVSASGATLPFKIECENLTVADWGCIAHYAAPKLQPFRWIFGVPCGGWLLAHALSPYRDIKSDVTLFVDDVWTTGKSLYKYVNDINRLGFDSGYDWKGFVAFARGDYPEERIKAFMRLAI